MKNSWVKKISVAMMLTVSLGMVACAGSQDFQDEEEGIEQNEGQNGPAEFFNGSGGSVVSDDDFVSVTTGDGGNFACDASGCSLF